MLALDIATTGPDPQKHKLIQVSAVRFNPAKPSIKWQFFDLFVDPGSNFVVHRDYLDGVHTVFNRRTASFVHPSHATDELFKWAEKGEPLCCAQAAHVFPFIRTLAAGPRFLSDHQELVCPVSLTYVPNEPNHLVASLARVGNRVYDEPRTPDSRAIAYATIVSRFLA